MARRKASNQAVDGLSERIDWILSRLGEYRVGVHRLGKAALLLDSALPAAVERVCREFDGADLFHESLQLLASSRIEQRGDLWRVAEWSGDDIFVDERGAVWRHEQDTEELLAEGTRFDRWLAGAIDAEAVLYSMDGEFRDEVFAEEGELCVAAKTARARCQVKRDPMAVAPRWRLARAWALASKPEQARALLEEVVEAKPDFPWAWFDLARISEELGQPEIASEEAEQAAEVITGYEHVSFFLAHAARLATLAGDEGRRERLAARVSDDNPDFARLQVEAARSLLEDDETEAARDSLLLAKAVAPRNLHVLNLLGQLQR